MNSFKICLREIVCDIDEPSILIKDEEFLDQFSNCPSPPWNEIDRLFFSQRALVNACRSGCVHPFDSRFFSFPKLQI